MLTMLPDIQLTGSISKANAPGFFTARDMVTLRRRRFTHSLSEGIHTKSFFEMFHDLSPLIRGTINIDEVITIKGIIECRSLCVPDLVLGERQPVRTHSCGSFASGCQSSLWLDCGGHVAVNTSKGHKMGWNILNASLSVSATSIPCKGGTITAKVTITGQTDDKEEMNSYTASIRDDYVIPDVLWKSEPQSVGADTDVNQVFSVELNCDKKRHVSGPNGSSGERVAELYAYVLGANREGASDETVVTCIP